MKAKIYWPDGSTGLTSKPSYKLDYQLFQVVLKFFLIYYLYCLLVSVDQRSRCHCYGSKIRSNLATNLCFSALFDCSQNSQGVPVNFQGVSPQNLISFIIILWALCACVIINIFFCRTFYYNVDDKTVEKSDVRGVSGIWCMCAWMQLVVVVLVTIFSCRLGPLTQYHIHGALVPFSLLFFAAWRRNR